MPTRINVVHTPADCYGEQIRILFCRESALTPVPGRNPLIETNFNDLLIQISQSAFDAGRMFERQHPNLE